MSYPTNRQQFIRATISTSPLLLYPKASTRAQYLVLACCNFWQQRLLWKPCQSNYQSCLFLPKNHSSSPSLQSLSFSGAKTLITFDNIDHIVFQAQNLIASKIQFSHNGRWTNKPYSPMNRNFTSEIKSFMWCQNATSKIVLTLRKS